MTGPAPDPSMPDVPSLRGAFNVFAPSGTDTDALRKSLKASRMPVTGQQGTTCAGCSGRGVLTSHSPAGVEHAAWEAKWAADPSWMPDGYTPAFRFSLDVPVALPARSGDDPGTSGFGLLGKAMKATENMRWCQRCARPEPWGAGCPNESVPERLEPRRWALPTGHCPQVGPDDVVDPFTPGQESGVAARVLYDDMLSAGIPLSSVENILGCMLAALVRQAPGADDG